MPARKKKPARSTPVTTLRLAARIVPVVLVLTVLMLPSSLPGTPLQPETSGSLNLQYAGFDTSDQPTSHLSTHYHELSV